MTRAGRAEGAGRAKGADVEKVAEKVKVARVSDVAEGSAFAAQVNGKAVALFKVKGTI